MAVTSRWLRRSCALAAPSINAPEFERDQISISGGFTQAEAEALAAGLG